MSLMMKMYVWTEREREGVKKIEGGVKERKEKWERERKRERERKNVCFLYLSNFDMCVICCVNIIVLWAPQGCQVTVRKK